MNKAWFLYVLRCSDDTLYTGITTDYKRRLHEHNNTARGAKYTRGRRPSEILFAESFGDHSSVLKAERRFKKLCRLGKKSYIEETIWIGDLVYPFDDHLEYYGVGIVIDMQPEWRHGYKMCNHYKVKWRHHDTSFWAVNELLLLNKK